MPFAVGSVSKLYTHALKKKLNVSSGENIEEIYCRYRVFVRIYIYMYVYNIDSGRWSFLYMSLHCCVVDYRVRFAFNGLHFRYSSSVLYYVQKIFVTFCIIRIQQLFYYASHTQTK